jgi:hypothetical protein
LIKQILLIFLAFANKKSNYLANIPAKVGQRCGKVFIFEAEADAGQMPNEGLISFYRRMGFG